MSETPIPKIDVQVWRQEWSELRQSLLDMKAKQETNEQLLLLIARGLVDDRERANRHGVRLSKVEQQLELLSAAPAIDHDVPDFIADVTKQTSPHHSIGSSFERNRDHVTLSMIESRIAASEKRDAKNADDQTFWERQRWQWVVVFVGIGFSVLLSACSTFFVAKIMLTPATNNSSNR